MTLNHRDLCRGIQSHEIDSVWGIAAPLIQKALDQGSDYDIDDIYEGLQSQEMQLWMWRDKAALVTSIRNTKNVKFCLLLALGGSALRDWLIYKPALEAWAKNEGCEEIRIYGRHGWAKYLPDFNICYTKLTKCI